MMSLLTLRFVNMQYNDINSANDGFTVQYISFQQCIKDFHILHHCQT